MSQPVGAEQVWTVGGLLQWTERFFAGKGVESPRLDAQILLAHALGCQRPQLYTRYDEVVAEEPRGRFRELVRQRVEGCPVAYLVGSKEFFLLPYEVSPAVLIPRPSTESLVSACLERAKPLAAPQVIDVGTGSGCIAVSVAKRHAGARVLAVDRSPEALAVARRNAERHGVADRVEFLESDLFDAVPAGQAFDFVLSNPPYIRSADVAGLAPEVRDHEPRLALDGGPNGFLVFDRLMAQAPARLASGGWLLIEIGADQEAGARERLAAVPDLALAPTIRDGDGHPRVIAARKG
jgi:release factor glutamine methyltransferase